MKKAYLFALAAILLTNVVDVNAQNNIVAASPSPSDSVRPQRFNIKTTVIVVRHAEKKTDCISDQTCQLLPEGEERAETLKYIADKLGVSVLYSTDFVRTKETVNNYADWKKIPVNIYSDVEKLVNDINNLHQGKVVLVAGHSPTVPQIVKRLGIDYPVSVGDNYDNIFIVTIFSPPPPLKLPLKPYLLPMKYEKIQY